MATGTIPFGLDRHSQCDTCISLRGLSGDEGLSAIQTKGPYAVVVSDLQMPGMDGIRFLAHVSKRAPDTDRVMLTGHADIAAAISAVNEGKIFRFLAKPVQHGDLVKALEASLEQHHLITAERELLERTLRGSIGVLTDVLALVNPIAFGRASRLKRYVRHIASQLKLPDLWQFEVAAMLSQIGCITLPPEVLEKIYAAQTLNPEEKKMYEAHPSIGRDLIIGIPRLEPVAQMIENQHRPLVNVEAAGEKVGQDVVALGSQILNVALEFDRRVMHGTGRTAAITELRSQVEKVDPRIVAALENFDISLERMTEARTVRVRDLSVGMILNQDLKAANEVLLVSKGQEVTFPVLKRLWNFAEEGGVQEPFRVLAPVGRVAAGKTDKQA